MHFAYPLPWWLAVLLAAAVGGSGIRSSIAARSRRSPARSVASWPALRVLALGALVLFLFRPVAMLPPSGSRDAVVPVLVDVSRSMRLADADGQPRLARAIALLKTDLMPALSSRFVTELYGVGDGLAPAQIDRLAADARRTDLAGALAAVRERYRGQRVAGIVVLSDGGDTGGREAAGRAGGGRTCRRPAGVRGRHRLAGRAARSRSARHRRRRSAARSGVRRPPCQRRQHRVRTDAVHASRARQRPAPRHAAHRAAGRRIADRRALHRLAGSIRRRPSTPRRSRPTHRSQSSKTTHAACSSARPAASAGCSSIEGAPGFEHSFMTRAWAADTGLEVDSVTRKGKNAEGQDTFLVQASAGRAATLTVGFPPRREQLYAYDAHRHRQRRGRFLHARAAGDVVRLRRRTRRRPARARRPLLRAAWPVRHAARGGAAGRTERPPRRGSFARR